MLAPGSQVSQPLTVSENECIADMLSRLSLDLRFPPRSLLWTLGECCFSAIWWGLMSCLWPWGSSLKRGGTLVSFALCATGEQFCSPKHSLSQWLPWHRPPKQQDQSLEQDLQNCEPKRTFPLYKSSRVFYYSHRKVTELPCLSYFVTEAGSRLRQSPVLLS